MRPQAREDLHHIAAELQVNGSPSAPRQVASGTVVLSDGCRFDYAKWRLRCDDALKTKAGFREKIGVFALRALHTSGHDHHVEVEKRAEMRLVGLGQHHFDQCK